MKYRYFFLLPLLILLLVLTGCACEHEWVAADCINPQICTKCNESGEPALGHDWLDATCSAPETCTRCSATQGKPLTHTYGVWHFTDEQMTHTCSVCGFAESTELDRELYLSTFLNGWWDFTALCLADGSVQPAEDLIYVDSYVFFGADRLTTVALPSEKVCEGVWEFESYAREGEQDAYSLMISSGEADVSMMLYVKPDRQNLLTVVADGVTLLYTQNPEISQFVAGDWGVKPYLGSIVIGADYWVSFHEDRTVEGYLNCPINGTWLLVPMSDSQCGIVIRYDQEEKEQLIQIKMDLPENQAVFYLNRKLPFEKKDETNIENIRKSREIILGTWTSLSLCEGSTYSALNTLKSPEEITHAYSITFQPDGTFSSSLGREYRGKWFVHDVPEADSYFSYELIFDNHEEPVWISLDQGDHILTCTGLPNTGSKLMLLAQLNEDALDFFSQAFELIGTWETSSGKSWTFLEDGTYTASLGSESSGTWEYRFFIIDEECTHSYWIYPDSSTTTEMLFIHQYSGFVFDRETYHPTDSSAAEP